jgi:hypothetical protein
MAEAKLPWLDSVHELWDTWSDFWLRQERRLFGGEAVKTELDPFSSEAETVKGGLERYARRQRQATYLNFPDVAATAFVGQLSRHAPMPGQGLNFGALGEVRSRDKLGTGALSRAEMAWYNIDGVGQDGSQWVPWWDGVTKRAKATGHRWCFVEAPFTSPGGFVDELNGMRPFMVEYSPYQVTNWHYVNGQLVWAIIRVPMRNPKVDAEGKMSGNVFEDGYYVLVQAGWEGLGPAYQEGGWWFFDANQELIPDGHATWDATLGKIPLWAHFYEQTKGPSDLPAMSRSGLAEVSNIAVSYMNQSSARDFDAWDAAKSLLFAMGISNEGWNLLQELMAKGSEILPILGEKNVVSGQTTPVSMYDGSTGAVTADVFKTLLDQKITEARELSNYEARSSPDSSGLSQQIRFSDAKSPRLSLMAANREQSENNALFFLSQRWGIPNAQASTKWIRDFNLAPLVDDIDKMFSTMKLAAVKSPTLTVDMIIAAAKKRGLITDEEKEITIRGEISGAMEQADKAAEAERQALAAFGAPANE